jgi:hypothetical protein
MELTERVIHPTPPPATLPGFHPLLFSHTRLETVGDRYVSGTSSSPNWPFSSFHCTFCFIRYLWRGSLCLHSSLPACTPHCQTFVIVFRNDGGSNALYPSKQWGKGNLSPDPINACVLDVNSVSLTINGIDVCLLHFLTSPWCSEPSSLSRFQVYSRDH